MKEIEKSYSSNWNRITKKMERYKIVNTVLFITSPKEINKLLLNSVTGVKPTKI